MQKTIAASHPEMSINDYVVGVCARRYGVEWAPNGVRSRKEEVGETILVKMPEPLWIELKREAVPYSTMSAVIIKAIREDK